MINFRKV